MREGNWKYWPVRGFIRICTAEAYGVEKFTISTGDQTRMTFDTSDKSTTVTGHSKSVDAIITKWIINCEGQSIPKRIRLLCQKERLTSGRARNEQQAHEEL